MRSIRKGCIHCGGELQGFKQKVLRTCAACAASAREGFAQMGEGKFKEGFSKVSATMYGDNIEKKELLKTTMKAGLSKREQKIRKKLKKRGLSDEEIEQGLKKYNEGFK